MATTTHLITADELLEMGGDARFELIEGVLKEISPSSVKPGLIGMRIGGALLDYVEAHELGYVSNAETGYILSSNPQTVVAPDVGFFRPDRYPGDFPERGFFPMPPDLAVEVISPADKRADIAQKQQLYARAGVSLVWWVDSEARTVTVHRLGQEPEVLDESMTLDGEHVLPGFSVPVERIFALKLAPDRKQSANRGQGSPTLSDRESRVRVKRDWVGGRRNVVAGRPDARASWRTVPRSF